MEIELDNITKSYGGAPVVDKLNLSLEKGEMVALLGPSGCGKTTTLRMVAGFVDVDEGAIRLCGKDVTRLPAYKRDCGLVFQSYALFPHLTVSENVAFGLRRRRVPAEERRRRVAETLTLMQLDGLGGRYPSELSGGQQQRVAVARAMAINPTILLLDEPFSNLDAKLRDSTGLELRRIQKNLGLTSIFVTHDQNEAMGIADRIAVMNGGVIEQVGSASEIYDLPSTHFIASFIGKANFLPGEVVEGGGVRLNDGGAVITSATVHTAGMPVEAMIRPENLFLAKNPAEVDLRSRIVDMAYYGSRAVVQTKTEGGTPLLVEIHGSQAANLAPGNELSLGISRAVALPRLGGSSL